MLSISILGLVGLAAALPSPHALATNNVTAPAVSYTKTGSYTPGRFSFNIIASDGNYVSQQYASDGAYLSSAAGDYVYTLNSDGSLESSSSDRLDCSGSGYDCNFDQDASNPDVCSIKGKYPKFTLHCAFEEDGVFGNNAGSLAYGTKAELQSNGATLVTLYVVPT